MGVLVGAGTGVGVLVGVGVNVGVSVGADVLVGIGVGVSVCAGVCVGVSVGSGVMVGVGMGSVCRRWGVRGGVGGDRRVSWSRSVFGRGYGRSGCGGVSRSGNDSG